MINSICKLGFVGLFLSSFALANVSIPFKIDLPPAKVGKPYKFDFAPLVKNPKGGPLSFSMTSAPKFLSLTPAGLLSGTPNRDDVANHVFRVLVQTGDGGSFSEVLLTVQKADAPIGALTCESGDKAHYVGETANGDRIYSCPQD